MRVLCIFLIKVPYCIYLYYLQVFSPILRIHCQTEFLQIYPVSPKNFILLGLDPFWANFCMWCELRVQLLSFARGFVVAPAPFVEKILLPLNFLGTLIENRLTTDVGLCRPLGPSPWSVCLLCAVDPLPWLLVLRSDRKQQQVGKVSSPALVSSGVVSTSLSFNHLYTPDQKSV